MKLHYCRNPAANFGDDLNPWLWPRMLPGFFDDDDSVRFLGIGTILDRTTPPAPLNVVCGAGTGYKPAPRLDDAWRIYCVRGPLTAAALRLDASAAVTDGAILVPQVASLDRRVRRPVAFMPHFQSLDRADWGEVCRLAGIPLIDPRQPVEGVLAEIAETGTLVTEAMHGAIVADAFRIPWISVRAYSTILPFKWLDWTRSMELEWRPHDLPPLASQPQSFVRELRNRARLGLNRLGIGPEKWRLSPVQGGRTATPEAAAARLTRIVAEAPPQLSTDAVFARNLERMSQCVDRLRRDFDGTKKQTG